MNSIEESIASVFGKKIWSRFNRGVSDYQLISPGDSIAVCISGGKDSMLLALCMARLQRFSKVPFTVRNIVMDPGYAPENLRQIEHNLGLLGLEADILPTKIFSSAEDTGDNPCFLCSRLRRGFLYKSAQDMGCNKIALGHHFDDVVETILMGMLYGGQVQTMMPKLHSTNFEGMELIRPLYLVREADIKHWRDYNGLHFLQCACKFTETCSSCDKNGQTDSKRLEVKHLIAELKKVNPQVEKNIFRSVENVNLSTIIAYKQHGEVRNFLDTYDE